MDTFIKIKESRRTPLEKFGNYYLKFFLKLNNGGNTISLTDQETERRIKKIILYGIIISSLISIVFVIPVVWLDIFLKNRPLWSHYGWLAVASVLSMLIELYLLFILALKLVTDISRTIHMDTLQSDFMNDGLFSVKSVLARTALELPDPELEILGIDPFKRISKKNLLIIGIIYKLKILLTNTLVKNLFILFSIKTVLGYSVLYAAVLVECFWNAVVIIRVVHEARLRLFGFALATRIIQNVQSSKHLTILSEEAKKGCLKAIGNAVVMTQNYHPNMVILLLSFQRELKIRTEERYDDWQSFLTTLSEVNEKERSFLLDLFTVAAAFDGKLSSLEKKHLKEAYGASYQLYISRLLKLTQHLKKGKMNKAYALCHLDFEEG